MHKTLSNLKGLSSFKFNGYGVGAGRGDGYGSGYGNQFGSGCGGDYNYGNGAGEEDDEMISEILSIEEANA
jgi:hypothetical protein